MITFGLTGGIGSGKSAVAARLVDRGVAVIDADQVVRDLQQPGQDVFTAIVERWGAPVVAKDGSLNRAALADIVFNDADELAALNAIVHPAVAAEMGSRVRGLAESHDSVVLDIPLLVGPDGQIDPVRYGHLDAVIVVDVDPETALDRLVASRPMTEAQVRRRMATQASREDRLNIADYVVDNSGNLDDLDRAVDELVAWIASHEIAATE